MTNWPWINQSNNQCTTPISPLISCICKYTGSTYWSERKKIQEGIFIITRQNILLSTMKAGAGYFKGWSKIFNLERGGKKKEREYTLEKSLNPKVERTHKHIHKQTHIKIITKFTHTRKKVRINRTHLCTWCFLNLLFRRTPPGQGWLKR